jgi:GNAT superfamily N-acetyltransferase
VSLIRFRECGSLPEEFFRLLPPDWSGEIEPLWHEYSDSTRIFCLAGEESVLAGGMVFSRVSPDTMAYQAFAEELFARGHLYIGFLFVRPDLRGEGLGSRWMRELIALDPATSYWLSIEDPGLSRFYRRFGFEPEAEMRVGESTEQILVRLST